MSYIQNDEVSDIDIGPFIVMIYVYYLLSKYVLVDAYRLKILLLSKDKFC